MSQETIETATEEQILGLPPEEIAADPPESEEPKAKDEDRVPVSELVQERRAKQMLEQELHTLRIATLQGIQPPAQPQPSSEDLVDKAVMKIAKQAGWGEDVTALLAPGLKPLIEELAYQRNLNQQILGELQDTRNQVARLSEKEQALAQNQELSRLIPDLDKLGPKMLELLKDMPDGIKQQYAANPHLLIPIANAVRASNGIAAPAAGKVNRGQLAVDTGAAPSQPLTLDGANLAAIKPNSKEFEALARSFYGEG